MVNFELGEQCLSFRGPVSQLSTEDFRAVRSLLWEWGKSEWMSTDETARQGESQENAESICRRLLEAIGVEEGIGGAICVQGRGIVPEHFDSLVEIRLADLHKLGIDAAILEQEDLTVVLGDFECSGFQVEPGEVEPRVKMQVCTLSPVDSSMLHAFALGRAIALA